MDWKELMLSCTKLRTEKDVLSKKLACDEEYIILENRIKIIEEERKHYMKEIEKSKGEAMELIKRKELIELQEESGQKHSC